MKILGIKPDSLIEWSNHLSFVIFIAGCNFKCPFCYVPYLVKEQYYKDMEEIEQDKVMEQIKERKDFIDAVCITGGEPTIHPELSDFLKKIKDIGLKVRIETNGSNPKVIEKLVRDKLIDSLALDIKNSKKKYKQTINTDIDLENIEKTIKIIKNSNMDYELRTTLVPDIHTEKDIIKIAEWLYNIGNTDTDKKKIKLYVLNQFKSDLPNEQTLDPEFMKKGDYPQEKLENIKNHLKSLDYFERVEVR